MRVTFVIATLLGGRADAAAPQDVCVAPTSAADTSDGIIYMTTSGGARSESLALNSDARVEAVSSAGGDGVDAVAVEETSVGVPPPPPPEPPKEPPEPAPAPANAMVNDPKYGIYFKMIKMGVPEQAVRNKMALDGVDASVLDANAG